MDKLPALLKKWLETSTPRQKLTAGLLAFSLLATLALAALGSATPAPANGMLDSSPLYFFDVFIKLIGVLLLVFASAAIYRRWMNLGPQAGPTHQLQLLETVRLSPKQALHLVSIGDQKYLIGATDNSIALIAPFEGAGTPAPVSAPQPGLDFSAVLQSIKG